MKALTVKQLAAISGVTVRTLHHYDEIGLLKPAYIGENGYRYYERGQLMKLQRILFHRELGAPLSEIAELLEMEGEDQIGALERHRGRLAEQRDHFNDLIETVDKTIAGLKGETHMSNADLYKGFSPEKQAEYEAWLIDSYGGDMPERIAVSRRAWDKLSEAERGAVMDELKDIETALAQGLRMGVPPEAAAVAGQVKRHKAWVAQMWDKPCPPEAYRGLAQMYLAHPDFRTRFEAIEPGFTDWLAEAMKAHADA